MTPFQAAITGFLAAPKHARGTPVWRQARKPPDQQCFWTLEVDGRATPHSLLVEARLASPVRAFCAMVRFEWQGREYPVLRVNVDTEEQYHINHGQPPLGVPMKVDGPRIYLWSDNQATFKPSMLGLPYCRPLERKLHTLDNAIRHLAQSARIELPPGPMPDYPAREGLL